MKELNLMGFTSRERVKWNADKNEVIGKMGGKKLSPEQLQRYIKSAIYAGIVCEFWTGNKPLKAPYEGLITIDVWNKANRGRYKINIIDDENIEILHYNGEIELEEAPIIQKPKNYNPDYMFGKVLQCPECGGHMTAEKSKSKSGKYHHYYSCRGKRGAKHTNYSLRRDEVNDEIVGVFSKANFNKQSLDVINIITANIYSSRKDEHIEKSTHLNNKIKELKLKQNTITSNISNLIQFPDLLEAQNNELQKIKTEISSLEIQLREKGEKFGLERFKNASNKILTHLDKLVLQKENPEIIQLAFDIVFGGKVEYESILSHTPLSSEFVALNTKKELQLDGNSSVIRKWSHTLNE